MAFNRRKESFEFIECAEGIEEFDFCETRKSVEIDFFKNRGSNDWNFAVYPKIKFAFQIIKSAAISAGFTSISSCLISGQTKKSAFPASSFASPLDSDWMMSFNRSTRFGRYFDTAATFGRITVILRVTNRTHRVRCVIQTQ